MSRRFLPGSHPRGGALGAVIAFLLATATGSAQQPAGRPGPALFLGQVAVVSDAQDKTAVADAEAYFATSAGKAEEVLRVKASLPPKFPNAEPPVRDYTSVAAGAALPGLGLGDALLGLAVRDAIARPPAPVVPPPARDFTSVAAGAALPGLGLGDALLGLAVRDAVAAATPPPVAPPTVVEGPPKPKYFWLQLQEREMLILDLEPRGVNVAAALKAGTENTAFIHPTFKFPIFSRKDLKGKDLHFLLVRQPDDALLVTNAVLLDVTTFRDADGTHVVRFKEPGTSKFKALTKALATQKKMLAIAQGEMTLAVLEVPKEVADGQLRLTFANGFRPSELAMIRAAIEKLIPAK